MKTIALMTAILLVASIGQAQTRLETEFQQLEQTAVASEKKKADEERARAEAEQNRRVQEAQAKLQQMILAKIDPLNAAIEAHFNSPKVSTMHTSVRNIRVDKRWQRLDYVLVMTKLENGVMCQLGIVTESYNGQAVGYETFGTNAFCVSTEGTYSYVAMFDKGRYSLSTLKDALVDASAGKYWNQFSLLRQLDIEQDKAKKAGYTRPAVVQCLRTSLDFRNQLAYTSSSFQNYYRSPSQVFEAEFEELLKAIQQSTSLDKFRTSFPGCFAETRTQP